MAKTRRPAAPTAPTQSTPAPYPANWARLSGAERQAWLQTNRPGRPTGAVGAAAAPAQPTSSAAPPEGATPVKLRVLLWKVQIGDRGAIECGTAELGEVLAQEMRAYENDQVQPGEGEEGEEGEDEF